MNKLIKMMPILALVLSILTVSCKDEIDEEKEAKELTEQSKDDLDDSMLKVVSKIEDLENLTICKLEDSLSFLNLEEDLIPQLLIPISNPESGVYPDLQNQIEEGILNLTFSDKVQWGTYSYNSDSETFEFTDGKLGVCKILCPSSSNSASNDLVLDLSIEFKNDVDYNLQELIANYNQTIPQNNDYEDLYDQLTDLDITITEICKKVNLTIKIETETILDYQFNIVFDDMNNAALLETTIQADDYLLEYVSDATDLSEKVTESFKLSYDNQNLIGCNLSLIGDLTAEHLDQMQEDLNLIDPNNPASLLAMQDAFAYDFKLNCNIDEFTLSGLISGQSLVTTMNKIESGLFSSQDQLFKELNQAVIMVLKNGEGKTVGKTEIYPIESENFPFGFRFKFADGTSLTLGDKDSEKEIQKIFEGFIEKIESMQGKKETENTNS